MIATGQVPVEHWHEHIGKPTIADAVLDRLTHGAHRLELKGESMRKLRAAKANLGDAGENEANFIPRMNDTDTRLGSLESPAGFDRNKWLVSIGIDGCNRRNAHQGVRDGRHRVLVIESLGTVCRQLRLMLTARRIGCPKPTRTAMNKFAARPTSCGSRRDGQTDGTTIFGTKLPQKALGRPEPMRAPLTKTRRPISKRLPHRQ
jgi:hypothetical protein